MTYSYKFEFNITFSSQLKSRDETIYQNNTSPVYFLLLITGSIISSVSGQSIGLQQDTVPKPSAVKQPVYTTTRLVTAKPVIDGKLDDECWKQANGQAIITSIFQMKGQNPPIRQN